MLTPRLTMTSLLLAAVTAVGVTAAGAPERPELRLRAWRRRGSLLRVEQWRRLVECDLTRWQPRAHARSDHGRQRDRRSLRPRPRQQAALATAGQRHLEAVGHQRLRSPGRQAGRSIMGTGPRRRIRAGSKQQLSRCALPAGLRQRRMGTVAGTRRADVERARRQLVGARSAQCLRPGSTTSCGGASTARRPAGPAGSVTAESSPTDRPPYRCLTAGSPARWSSSCKA